eukprot:6392507-Amphidinium_carterae.1
MDNDENFSLCSSNSSGGYPGQHEPCHSLGGHRRPDGLHCKASVATSAPMWLWSRAHLLIQQAPCSDSNAPKLTRSGMGRRGSSQVNLSDAA